MRRCWKWDLLNLIGCWEREIKVGVFVWWDNYKEGEVVASYIANDKCLLISRRGHSEEGGREVCRVSNECGSYYTHLFMVGLSDECRPVPFFRRFNCRARLLVFGSHPLTGIGLI